MAASSEPSTSNIGDLTSILKIITYKSTVQYLPDTHGVDLRQFDSDSLSQQYYLDTSHVVTKRKTYNVMCLYETFAEYCELTPQEVKQRMLCEIKKHRNWFKKAGMVCLGMRQTDFEHWLKKLEKPRTWPNELALYALCVTFRRNAMVFNAGRIWTSMEVDSSMTQGICQKMCESTLLYLGNNLYGILRRRPFTLERPIQTLLDDTQCMRPLFVDANMNTMYFEMRKDSSYETAIQEEEIEIPAEQKPELLPDVPMMSILDPDYVPDYLPVKREPEWDQAVVGHLIDQPGPIAKEIKQELLDTAAQSIASKHTSSCQLTQFVHEREFTGFRIEDVRSLLHADEQSDLTSVINKEQDSSDSQPQTVPTVEKPTMRWSRVLHRSVPVDTATTDTIDSPQTSATTTDLNLSTTEPEQQNTKTLSVVTTARTPASVDTVASQILPVSGVPVSSPSDKALSVVTTHTVPKNTEILNVVTDADTDPVASNPGELVEPLSVVTTNKSATNTETLNVVTGTCTASTPLNTDAPEPLNMVTPSSSTRMEHESSGTTTGEACEISLPSSFRYYDVLTPEEDNIISISHQELMDRQCNVTLEKLNPEDIAEITGKIATKDPSDNATDQDTWKTVKRKKKSHRPLRHPSKSRMAAQKQISSRNRQIKAGKIPLTVPKQTAVPLHRQSKGMVHAELVEAESDDTIIYDPPVELPAIKKSPSTKRKKPAAKFIIRTIGLKHHKDAAMIQQVKKTRKRVFKCYLCEKRFPSTRELNKHFKKDHYGLDCETCGREFNSPLSLKRHSYIHGTLAFPCGYCNKSFPFKSERDTHENVHTKALRFPCNRSGCSSSFSRESDLKLHIELHDAVPLKCSKCEYSNPDIRNLRQHERVHSDVKPYKCLKCEQSFKFAMQRKWHEKIAHT